MHIFGQIELPGDKSISHRALMLSSLSNETSEIINISTGEDVKSTMECLRQCGINIKEENGRVIVTGNTFEIPSEKLDCGNSGTTTRLLAGLLAGQNVEAVFEGDESLSKRPMKRIIQPLSEMGAVIASNDDTLPIKIIPSNLKGINYSPEVASAQVKSCILLAGLGAEGATTVNERIQTRNHTELMLAALGAEINVSGNSITVSKLQYPLKHLHLHVPGDPSSAAYFIAAALLLENSTLAIRNILLNKTRTGFIRLLKECGASIDTGNVVNRSGEDTGDLVTKHSQLQPFNISEKDIPSMIDEIPILAIIATQIEGESIVSGASELRKKESDRIRAIYSNLKTIGADIQEYPDGFKIKGPTKLRGGFINTFNDHRIAMAFTIASLISEGDTILDNTDCINISFPEFFPMLASVLR